MLAFQGKNGCMRCGVGNESFNFLLILKAVRKNVGGRNTETLLQVEQGGRIRTQKYL